MRPKPNIAKARYGSGGFGNIKSAIQTISTGISHIHSNPVKHDHVPRVADWPYSTFHRYIRAGVYPENWCGGENPTFDAEGFGETP